MLPIYANCFHGVAIGCACGFFMPVDNLGISWHESHKKPNKIYFSCGSGPAKALDKPSAKATIPVQTAAETPMPRLFFLNPLLIC